jgi:hypothetical protein
MAANKAKSANKTSETKVDVSKFLEKVSDDTQRADAEVLIKLLKRLSGSPAKMWGPSIIGFGSYHYRYESGREGEMCRIGFSPRKGQTVLYAMGAVAEDPGLAKRLGKCKTGKGCLYIKRLAEVDMKVLEEVCKTSLAYVDKTYPRGM